MKKFNYLGGGGKNMGQKIAYPQQILGLPQNARCPLGEMSRNHFLYRFHAELTCRCQNIGGYSQSQNLKRGGQEKSQNIANLPLGVRASVVYWSRSVTEEVYATIHIQIGPKKVKIWWNLSVLVSLLLLSQKPSLSFPETLHCACANVVDFDWPRGCFWLVKKASGVYRDHVIALLTNRNASFTCVSPD